MAPHRALFTIPDPLLSLHVLSPRCLRKRVWLWLTGDSGPSLHMKFLSKVSVLLH